MNDDCQVNKDKAVKFGRVIEQIKALSVVNQTTSINWGEGELNWGRGN